MQKVTDPALLAQLNGGQSAPAPTGRRAGIPELVVAPRPKVQSPAEAERLGMERERLRMSQEDQTRQSQQAALSAQNALLDIEKKQRAAAAGDTADAIESERKAASFLLRALGSNRDYEAQDIGPRSYIGQKMADNAPDVLNTLPGFIGNSPERQISDSAQDAFIAASLRQDSGAAIPPEELERQRRIYFPMPGDTPDVIAAKAERRKEAIIGLRMSAGRLADESMAEYEARTVTMGGRADGPENGPNVLPSARMGREDPGIGPTGVQDSGTGGLRPVPEFKGMAGDVQAMIQQGAGADQVLAYVAKRHADAGYPAPNEERQQFIRDVVAARQARPDIPAGSLGQGWQNLEMVESPDTGGTALGSLADTNLGAGAIGAADVVTGGFLDEIAGLLGGNTDNTRAVMSASADERPVPTLAGNLAGGAMLPVGRAGATAKGLAKAGGGYGAVYGAGSADGDLDERAAGALGGGLLGAVSGYGVGKYAQGAGARSAAKAQRRADRASLLYDFTEQGVDALPANVGGPTSRVATSGAGQALLSSGSIRDAVGQQADQFGEAVGRNAQMAGSALPADEAGQLVRSAGERFSKKTSQTGSRLYDRAEAAAGDVKIVPQQAIAEIDAKIGRLSQSPDAGAASVVKELEAFKGRLADGVSIVGLRDARTRLSQGVYDGKLRSTADQKVYRDILGKVSDDIEQGLRAEGKDRVAGMFKTADKYWTERVEYIDKVLEPIIGKDRSGEAILQSVESMAGGKGGGVNRLSKMMQSLSDAERGDVQATIIDRIGRATKGNQDDTGGAFSASTFLTNWNGLSSKGKAALFGDGDLRSSLDQLARVASNIKDVSRYTNTSNTAGALGWQAALSGATGVISFPAAVLAGAGQYITGKMLASPKFAAWLARAPKNATPAQARAYSERLKNIATAEPVIASDIGRFSQFLNAANDTSPSVAVAGPQGQQEND